MTSHYDYASYHVYSGVNVRFLADFDTMNTFPTFNARVPNQSEPVEAWNVSRLVLTIVERDIFTDCVASFPGNLIARSSLRR